MTWKDVVAILILYVVILALSGLACALASLIAVFSEVLAVIFLFCAIPCITFFVLWGLFGASTRYKL